MERTQTTGRLLAERLLPEPELYRVRREARPGAANCYVLRSGGEVLAVDPWPCGALFDLLRELGAGDRPPKLAFTHLHGGWSVPGVGGGPLLAHPLDCRFSGGEIKAYQARRYRREGCPKGAAELSLDLWPPCETPVLPLCGGEGLTVGAWTLRCLHTPGHTAGHTCLLLPEAGLLFSGDQVLFDREPYVGVWKGEPHALEDALDSLERLRSLTVSQVLPAHGAAGTDLAGRADTITRRFYFRLLELYQLICDHPGRTAYELARPFCRREGGWDGLPPRRRWFAMGETLSHLAYLRDRGYVETRRCPGGAVNVPGKRKLTDG